MLVDYARVSTQDQRLELQRDALRRAGCRHIFEDKMSGTKAARPALRKAIAMMTEGDTLVIWKLSRLGRSVRQLIETVQLLQDRGIALWSLEESIDTSTALGKLLFHILAAFAQFERDNTVENTMAGLAAARARGRTGGRRRRVLDDRMRGRLVAFRDAHPTVPVERICASLCVSRATYYRYLEALQSEQQGVKK